MSMLSGVGTKKPDYGLDAPGLVRFFFSAGTLAACLAFLAVWLLLAFPTWRLGIGILLGIVAIYLLGMGCFMIFGSKVMKLRDREKILSEIAWCGDERVLDVGCGRGLMLIAAAKRLTTGKAIGIDIWQAVDQSSNTPEAAMENARLEGVTDRVSIDTGDMRILPYSDGYFDVIVSHWVVHNLASETDRRMAISEMVRVLRPGGQLILTDIVNRSAYSRFLASLKLDKIRLAVDTKTDFTFWLLSFGSYAPATHYGCKRNA